MITIPQVFVITGTPGTGKTTVSKVLSTKMGATHIELSKFSKENGYILEEDEARDTSVVDMDAINEAVSKIVAESDNPVILDGHYAQDVLDPEQIEKVVILRKQPWDLKTMLEEREYHGEKVWENLEAEIMGVITVQSAEIYPPEKLVEVDTSEKTITETVEEITATINIKENTKFDPIDWVLHPETLRLLMSRPCT